MPVANGEFTQLRHNVPNSLSRYQKSPAFAGVFFVLNYENKIFSNYVKKMIK